MNFHKHSSLSFISGATQSSFSTLNKGNYAVRIEYGKCLDTSKCYNISILPSSIYNSEEKSQMGVFPNPTSSMINVMISDQESVLKMSVTDVTGKELYKVSGFKSNLDLSFLPQGTYILSIFTSEEQIQLKVLRAIHQ